MLTPRRLPTAAMVLASLVSALETLMIVRRGLTVRTD
jgi:hypothetical protein